jgi:hypothetical protein
MITLSIILVCLFIALSFAALVYWCGQGGVWGWFQANQCVQAIVFLAGLLPELFTAFKQE